MSYRCFIVLVINIGVFFTDTYGLSTSTSSPLVKTTGNQYKLETASQVYDVETQERVEVTNESTPVQVHCTSGSCSQVLKTSKSDVDSIKADVVVRIETKAKLDQEHKFNPPEIPEISTIGYGNSFWDNLSTYPGAVPDLQDSFHIPNDGSHTNTHFEEDAKSGITVHTAIKINKGDKAGVQRGIINNPRIGPPYIPENINFVPYNPNYERFNYDGVFRRPAINPLPPTNHRSYVPLDPHHRSLPEDIFPPQIPNPRDSSFGNSHYNPYSHEDFLPGTPYQPRYGLYDHPIPRDYPSAAIPSSSHSGRSHDRYYPPSQHQPGTNSYNIQGNQHDTRQDYDIYHRQTNSNGVYSYGRNPEVPLQPGLKYPQPTYPRPNYPESHYPPPYYPQSNYPQFRLPLPRYPQPTEPPYEPQPYPDSRPIGSDPYQSRAQIPLNRLYGLRGIYRPQYPYQPRNLEPNPRPSISTTEEDDVKTYDYNTNGNDLRSIPYFETQSNQNNRGESPPVQQRPLPRDYTYNPVEFRDIPKISDIDLEALLPKNNYNNRSSYRNGSLAAQGQDRRHRNEKCDCDRQSGESWRRNP